MQNCENDKSDHQMRKKYFQFQRNEQSEIVSELHQCFWGGLSEVWEKTKITLCFTHIQEGWQEFSRKLVTSKIYFEAVTFPAAALRGSPHSSHNQLLLWDEQACLAEINSVIEKTQKMMSSGKKRAYSTMCEQCGKEGPIQNIKDHIAKDHVENTEVSCNQCNLAFDSKAAFKDHIVNSHEEPETISQ